MTKTIAYFLSVVFHPLLMATYMLVILLFLNPYLFGVNNISEQWSLVIIMMLSTVFMPALLVIMLKHLEVVPSIELENREDRIIPYILAGFFYVVMTTFFAYHPNMPDAFTAFMMGATIGLFLAFFINLFSKISAHTTGMGGLVGMVLITVWQFSSGAFSIRLGTIGILHANSYLLLMLVILIAGLVGTARLRLEAHEQQDIYGGYLIGFMSQIVAYRIMF